jgi:hypothetical protein
MPVRDGPARSRRAGLALRVVAPIIQIELREAGLPGGSGDSSLEDPPGKGPEMRNALTTGAACALVFAACWILLPAAAEAG